MISSLKWLLLPLGIIHWLLVWLRNKCFDLGIFRQNKLPVPVISVGNIQLGGTGKTPMVLHLLEHLQDQYKIAVLTRGYHRQSKENIIAVANEKQKFSAGALGDEPYLIFQKMRNGVIGIGANRFAVGQQMLAKFSAEMILLDDGFQRRQLHRDVDICLIDVSQWRKHPFLFPFSRLRDIKSSLNRADIFVLTKAEGFEATAQKLASQLKIRYKKPVFQGKYLLTSFIRLEDDSEISLATIASASVGAFCGIANGAHFFTMLAEKGISLSYSEQFSDHFHYTKNALEKLAEKTNGIKYLLTTEKDAVKLREQTMQEAFRQKIVVATAKFEVSSEDKSKTTFIAKTIGHLIKYKTLKI